MLRLRRNRTTSEQESPRAAPSPDRNLCALVAVVASRESLRAGVLPVMFEMAADERSRRLRACAAGLQPGISHASVWPCPAVPRVLDRLERLSPAWMLRGYLKGKCIEDRLVFEVRDQKRFSSLSTKPFLRRIFITSPIRPAFRPGWSACASASELQGP